MAKTVSFVLTCAVLKLQFFGTRHDHDVEIVKIVEIVEVFTV